MSFTESGTGGAFQRELNTVKKSNEKLKEENNLLKLKVEILLNLVSEDHRVILELGNFMVKSEADFQQQNVIYHQYHVQVQLLLFQRFTPFFHVLAHQGYS